MSENDFGEGLTYPKGPDIGPEVLADRIHDWPPSEDTYQYPPHPVSECSPDFCGKPKRNSREN